MKPGNPAIRATIRIRHYSRRTEQAYVHWVKCYIFFHKKRHPAEMGEKEVTAFLNHLAVVRDVAASTQNQALSALLFLYREVLRRELTWLDDLQRAKRPARLPVVLTRKEAQAILAQLDGSKWLMASLLYGSGLRLMECLRLRVKGVDFERGNGVGLAVRVPLRGESWAVVRATGVTWLVREATRFFGRGAASNNERSSARGRRCPK